jgi:hypothetical protein
MLYPLLLLWRLAGTTLLRKWGEILDYRKDSSSRVLAPWAWDRKVYARETSTVILFGGAVPFVLRSVENGFRIIGSCYIHGIMNGELVSNFEKVGMLDLSGHLIKWESEFEG